MALVEKFGKIVMDQNRIHEPVECSYSVFATDDGKKFLQLDTYGSATRKLKGKKSQSLQFNEKSLRDLKKIIDSVLR